MKLVSVELHFILSFNQFLNQLLCWQEAARAKVENEISRDTLELSHTMTRVERLKKALSEMDKEIHEKNAIISRSENEIVKRNAVIERKQGLIDQYNKKVEAVVSEQGVGIVDVLSTILSRLLQSALNFRTHMVLCSPLYGPLDLWCRAMM